jgi:hypothetical protein
MGQTVRFQETLRRLAMIDEGFVEDQAGLGPGLAAASALDPKTRGVAASRGVGGPRVTGGLPGMGHRPGASEDEIAGVLLAIRQPRPFTRSPSDLGIKNEEDYEAFCEAAGV